MIRSRKDAEEFVRNVGRYAVPVPEVKALQAELEQGNKLLSQRYAAEMRGRIEVAERYPDLIRRGVIKIDKTNTNFPVQVRKLGRYDR